MEQNKQKNSKRRLNSLILLVAFTAIMLIVSTYAWFSTQRNVSISNLTGTVKVAEGLEISLDADHWSQEVDFSQYSDQTTLKKLYGETEHNVIPTEMLPVSSNGAEGIDATEIPFYRGVNTNTKELGSIVAVEGVGSTTTASDATFPGYYAIDLFLRNSGIKEGDTQGTTKETLQLSSGSTLAIKSGGSADTGLQNTPRIAFALFSGTADVSSTSQSQVLTGTNAASSKISDVAIWEPNSNAHVGYIVTNYNNITWKTGEAAKYIADTTNYKYTASEKIPTYALTATSVSKTFPDLYNWSGVAIEDADPADTGSTTLSKQISLQTANGATSGVYNLISVNSDEASIYPIGKTGSPTQFQILKNVIVKLRMYVWLEGQDPDCVNYASHGSGIELDLGLCKGEDANS